MNSDMRESTEIDRNRKFDAVLQECIHSLHSGVDINFAINRLLENIANFHAADRAYIFEIDWDSSLLHNTYEWCREGVESQIALLQDIDISVIDRWLVQFEEKGEFYINSLSGEISEDSDEYQILAMQDIESLMAAPLRLGGRLVGFMGVDNPRDNTDTLLLMRSVASFVVNDIQRRVTVEQQMIGAIANIYISMHLLNIPEDTQREFHSNKEIRRFVNHAEGAAEQMRAVMEGLLAKEYIEEALLFSDLGTLNERMRENDAISFEFLADDMHWCRANFIVVSRDGEGNLEQVIYAVQYIDREKKRELEYQRALKQALENQNEMYSEMLQMQSVGVLSIKAGTGDILLINDSALKMFGFESREEFDGKISTLDERIISFEGSNWTEHFGDGMEGQGPFAYEFMVGNGEERKYILSHSKMASLANGDKVIILTLTDVTEKEKMEQKLRILSQTDALTQISNRGHGEKQIEDMLAGNVSGMLCLFDVDNFKAVNDCFGHIVGDKILIELAGCLKRSFGGDDVIMRLGGDEFAVYAVGVESESEGEVCIQRFFEEVEDIKIKEMDGRGISVSLGAVLRVKDSTVGFDELYQMADSAMYICKNNKGNYFRFYQV